MSLSTQALSRVIYQYRNSKKFKNWIDILPTIVEKDISPACTSIINLINVDNASGEALNICGRIVGIPERPKIPSDQLRVFAYDGTPGAQPYDVAPYIGDDEEISSIPLPDYLYRLVIRSKIVKNTSDATIDDVKRGVQFILGGEVTVTVVDLQNMAMRVILNSEVPFNVLAVLEIFDVAPRPQGVRLEYITSMPNQDTPGSFGGETFGGSIFGGDTN